MEIVTPLNPYNPPTYASPSIAEPRRSRTLSHKRIAWNAFIAFFAFIFYAEIYYNTPITVELTEAISRPVDSIYAVSNIARLACSLIPAIALLAFSTLYFTKRGPAMRLPFVLPVLTILLEGITPPGLHFLSLVIYLTIVSPNLIAGLGWPILIRRQCQRLGNFIAKSANDG